MELSSNAVQVLEARYLRRDAEGKVVETPAALFERVARGVSQAELHWGGAREAKEWEEKFLEMLTSLAFLPNSPTLMNAGTPLGQLSACFVLPVHDSTESIFEAVKHMALVQRTGGGTGFSFSELRPRGALLSSTSGEASGPVSFMSIFDCTTEHIKQGGRRRGANMGVLHVSHPDIRDFVRAKAEEPALRNFNISVAVTDAFMEAVRRDLPQPLVDPHSGAEKGTVQARELFEDVANAAWRSGDPGLIFLDAVGRYNPTPHLGPMEATNPCGEIPLYPYESCNLGSINLSRMIRRQGQESEIDWDRLKAVTHQAVRFLDDVIEVNAYPLGEIREVTQRTRKIGLGVMGWAEMLVHLGVPYDAPVALELAERVAEHIRFEALLASEDLAARRGVYPAWKGSVHEAEGSRVRNATRTAIAPTGTIGIIAGTSPSIEPLFALAYRRSHVLEGETLLETNPSFQRHLESNGFDADAIAGQVLEQGSLVNVPDVPESLQRLFVTALEISSESHLQMQAAFQRHVGNSVSKTINMPRDASAQDVADAYWRAWELGLKGVTLYRYGSKSQQVMELGAEERGYHYDHGSSCDPEECKL
jgi:ribonucleoside-diphosphate reductase alpha chain